MCIHCTGSHTFSRLVNNICQTSFGSSAATRLVTEEGVAEEAQLMWTTMDEVVRADYGKEYFDYIMKILQQTAFGGVS